MAGARSNQTSEWQERMTRIGLAYNQKPDQAVLRLEEDDALSEDEPPSSRITSLPGDATPPSASTDDEFAEWDSAETIAAVEQALQGLGDVVRLEATADFPERLRAENPDIVFNMAEGLRGANREAHIPAICEFAGIPYSGSDPFTLSLCLDKARTKEVLGFHGVRTAKHAVVRDSGSGSREWAIGNGESWEWGMGESRASDRAKRSSQFRFPLPASCFPVFVKPVHEGSSKGITERNLCRNADELDEQIVHLLERYNQPVLVEEYLPGAEFTCAVLGNGRAARVLPIVGMRFDALPAGALPVYGFEAKWLWDRHEKPLEIFECPARIDEALRCRIEEIVLAAYRVLGCRDWSRVDVRLDAAGVPNVVEVNPLPGILPDPADNSCLPKAARAAGMSYDQLIQACVRHAAERQGLSLSRKATRRSRRAAALG